MNFGTWDMLFNLLALVFWFRVWPGRDRESYFNPYLAPVERVGGMVTGFLRPVVPLPDRFVSLLVVAAVIVFRALLAPTKGAWLLTLGLSQQAADTSVAGALGFSVLSFAIFLFRLWGVSLIYARGSAATGDHTEAALHSLSRPFSDWHPRWRPAVLFVYGCALVVLLGSAAGAPAAGGAASFLRVMVLCLVGWVQNLPILMEAMFMLIIASWIGMFAAPGVAMLTRDWMYLLLGPLRSRPIRLGMFDLSPLIFFFAVWLAYTLLMTVLAASLQALS